MKLTQDRIDQIRHTLDSTGTLNTIQINELLCAVIEIDQDVKAKKRYEEMYAQLNKTYIEYTAGGHVLDFFANAALQGLLARRNDLKTREEDREALIEIAFDIAEGMVKERYRRIIKNGHANLPEPK